MARYTRRAAPRARRAPARRSYAGRPARRTRSTGRVRGAARGRSQQTVRLIVQTAPASSVAAGPQFDYRPAVQTRVKKSQF